MVSQYHESFKDSPPARYRTSTFPMFPYHQLEGSSIRGNTTMQSVNSSMKKEEAENVPRKHEGPRPLHAQQPIIVEKTSPLTSDVTDDGSMELLEKKKLEKMMNDIGRRQDSGDKYRGHIPTLVKVRQKSLPPVTKPKQCHVQTRQTSMAASDKRRKSQTAESLNVTKKSSIKTEHVQARDMGMASSKPRFQGGPYEAKPFKLLPPIAPKMGEKKKPTKGQVHDGESQNKWKPIFIAVRHTKKSAQIESRAKAKLDAEKAAIQEALIKVKQPLASIATKPASKTRSTASGVTASDWSTTCIAPSSPHINESIVSVPPIPQLAHTFNATLAKSIETSGKASVNVPTCPHSSSAKRESPLSRSSSKSSRLTRSGRDHRSRPRSVSSSRSKRSAERSTRVPESKRSSSSIVPSPRTSSQNSLTVRSAPTRSPSPNGVKKSARLSTPGSCKHTDMADDRKMSRKTSASKYQEDVRSVSRRSRRDERLKSPSPRGSGKSSRCSLSGPARSKMKVKPDKSGSNALEHSDYKSDCSPLSTARSSANSSRPPSVSSDSASSSGSVSDRSRNASRMKSAMPSRRSSCTSKMSTLGPASPVKRDRSKESSPSKYDEAVRNVSRRSRRDERSKSPSPRGSGKSSRCSLSGSARSKMKAKPDKSDPDAFEHSDYKSDCSPLSTARSTEHSSRSLSVSSGSASTSRPSTALNRPSAVPFRRPSTVRQSVSSVRPKTAASDRQKTAASDRPKTAASDRPKTAASDCTKTAASDRPKTAASDRPNTATSDRLKTAASDRTKTAASDRPNTAASDRPKTAASDRPKTAASDRPKTAASDRLKTAASDRPNTAATDRLKTAASDRTKTAASDRPKTAASVRPKTAPDRPKTASIRPSTAPKRQRTASTSPSTASTSHSTASIHRIPLSERSNTRMKAPPVNTSPRSSNSICSVTPLQSNRSSSRASTSLSNRL